MSSKPMVSVVINFLNAELFIKEAIQSVLDQTYDDWELLLVDDGSSDTSTAISKQYALLHPEKIYYLEFEGHQNRGASASRNLGSLNANGKYIAFLDADDVWFPHKLEQQVAILETHPEAAMVYGRQRLWFSWTGNPEDRLRDFIPDHGLQPNTLIKPPKLLPAFLRNESATPLPSSLLIRRSTNTAIGGFEETFKSIYDDQVYCVKVGLKAPVFSSGECWHLYRQHPGQRCYVTVETGQYHSARKAFLYWLKEYLSIKGIQDREVRAALKKELWPYRHPILKRLLTQVKVLVKWIALRILPTSFLERLRNKYRPRVEEKTG